MITVEALVQQLAAARANGCSSAGPAPSDLREKLVQTDHTELSQVSTHSDMFKGLTLRDVKHLEFVLFVGLVLLLLQHLKFLLVHPQSLF